MSNDIIVRLKQRKVTHIENYTTSELTCRSCGSKEEIEGIVDINNLSKGWTALSLDALETGVFKWLLCPICTKEVRFAAGLQKGYSPEERIQTAVNMLKKLV